MKRGIFPAQHGFGAIAAIIVLVLLAGLAAGIVSLSSTQSLTLAQDVSAARANQSARAGVDWGVYQAISGSTGWNGASCVTGTSATPVSTTLSLVSTNGTSVTVSCWSQQFNEGETCSSASSCTPTPVRAYTILAVASQGNSSTLPNYVERRRQAVVYH
jgi:MSHA biogenesis protein MshP